MKWPVDKRYFSENMENCSERTFAQNPCPLVRIDDPKRDITVALE